MFINIPRQRINCRRPPGVVMLDRSEMVKDHCGVVRVYAKQTNCHASERQSSKEPKILLGNLRINRLRQEGKRQKGPGENHCIVVRTACVRCNHNLREDQKPNNKEEETVFPIL